MWYCGDMIKVNDIVRLNRFFLGLEKDTVCQVLEIVGDEIKLKPYFCGTSSNFTAFLENVYLVLDSSNSNMDTDRFQNGDVYLFEVEANGIRCSVLKRNLETRFVKYVSSKLVRFTFSEKLIISSLMISGQTSVLSLTNIAGNYLQVNVPLDFKYLNNPIESSCKHLKKRLNYVMVGGVKEDFYYCPDCKEAV